jgi:rubrerythrin
MPSPQSAAASAEQATGTTDTTYNLVSVLYHAFQGAETYRQYVQDAEQAGDPELVQFFHAAQAWQQHLATQAKEVLTQRLSQSEGRAWNPEAKIWNLKIMA